MLLDGNHNVLSVGFNHYLKAGVIHAERDALRRLRHSRSASPHASADIRTLLQSDSVSLWIVELDAGAGYNDAPPCGGCSNVIRQAKLKHVYHTDGAGDVTHTTHHYD